MFWIYVPPNKSRFYNMFILFNIVCCALLMYNTYSYKLCLTSFYCLWQHLRLDQNGSTVLFENREDEVLFSFGVVSRTWRIRWRISFWRKDREVLEQIFKEGWRGSYLFGRYKPFEFQAVYDSDELFDEVR